MGLRKLVVGISGLCMLVKRRSTPAGLYVLMPSMGRGGSKHDDGASHEQDEHGHGADAREHEETAHEGRHEPHCPYLYVEGEFTGGAPVLKSIGKQVTNLREIGTSGGSEPQFSGRVVEMGSYISGDTETVDPHWVDVPTPEGCLAARVELPLRVTNLTFPSSERADLLIPDRWNHTNHLPAHLYGRVELEYTIHPEKPDLEVDSVRLSPNAQGVIEINFMNVRPIDAIGGKQYAHAAGRDVHHVNAYYSLLRPRRLWCDAQIKLGQVRIGKDVAGDSYVPDYTGCGRSSTAPAKMRHIDPYNCTLGGGCLPNEPC